MVKELFISPWNGFQGLALWSFIQIKLKLENWSAEECLLVMYPVLELASFYQVPFLVLLHCLPAYIRPGCHFYFLGLILYKVAVYNMWCMAMALQPSATQTKGMPSPAGVQGSTSVTSGNRPIRHTKVSCHPSPLDLHDCCNMESVMPSWWTTNLERFQSNWHNAGELPLTLFGHESGYVLPSRPLLHVSTRLLLPLTAWNALSVHYWCMHLQLQSKTNNHRVIIYLMPLPTFVKLVPPMCR